MRRVIGLAAVAVAAYPTGCKGCVVAPDGVSLTDGPITRSCFAEFSARQSSRSRRVVVSVRSRSCF